MFMTKKKRMLAYMNGITDAERSAFDSLVSDYLSGVLKTDILACGITKIEIHVDWFDDIKCIGIAGRYGRFFVQIDIYPEAFDVRYDQDEPDEAENHPLESKEQVYSILKEKIELMNKAV